MTFSHCKRCGRGIKNPEAQKIGYGKTCLKKHQKEFKISTGQELGEGGQTSLPYFLSYL